MGKSYFYDGNTYVFVLVLVELYHTKNDHSFVNFNKYVGMQVS